MQIQFTGTIEELIELADTLKAGKQPRPSNTPEDEARWREHLREVFTRDKIGAIKAHRARTGCGLKEAKDYVEAL